MINIANFKLLIIKKKKTEFTKTKIVSMLKKQEPGIATAYICIKFGIIQATNYNWKAKNRGLEVQEV